MLVKYWIAFEARFERDVAGGAVLWANPGENRFIGMTLLNPVENGSGRLGPIPAPPHLRAKAADEVQHAVPLSRHTFDAAISHDPCMAPFPHTPIAVPFTLPMLNPTTDELLGLR